jgi:hypothetical protein
MLSRLCDGYVWVSEPLNVYIVSVEVLNFLKVIEEYRGLRLFLPCLDRIDYFTLTEACFLNLRIVSHEAVGTHLVSAKENSSIDLITFLDELIILVFKRGCADNS